ncbi:MAG TPA: App1 family protein [Candidatus Acidoferrum sp.]|nr:App1 family protein [Candidatus Acidoferrum sp.]
MRKGWPRAAALSGAIAAALGASSARAGSAIDDDEDVVLFTTAAHLEGRDWVVPVHAWVFEPERDSIWRNAVLRGLRHQLGIESGDPRAARFALVARWFLVDNERGKRLDVRVGGTSIELPPTGASGHALGSVRVPAGGPGAPGWLALESTARDGRRFRGQALLVPPTGISVVSDVDDTIKVTEVLAGKRRVLKRTFAEPFEPVAGMPELYRRWRAGGAVFHYVSASPWHLYPELNEFLRSGGFPEGTLDLRHFRVKDGTRWNLLGSPQPHKQAAIESLLARFPRRRFVLVGDSGEIDPEIYGAIARAHPGRIAAIFIRRLPGDGWTAARRQRAFAGVRAPVVTFARPAELPALTRL